MKVALVEDDEDLCAVIAEQLRGSDEFHLVGVGGTLAEGEALIRSRFDILLVDLRLGAESGIDLIRSARAASPAKIVVISVHGDEKSTLSAIEAGADGYLLKGDPRLDLITGLRRMVAGEAPISPAIAGHLLKRLRAPQPGAGDNPLSPREQQILEELALGYSYKETAARLDLSVNTVNAYIKTLYKKLAVSSRAQAVRVGVKRRLISMSHHDERR
ncbi:MAG: response regulator transcription factor [Pseudomonadota bacterium]